MLPLKRALEDENLNKENRGNLIREIQNGNVVFFVGSAVSFATPSCLLSSGEIKEKVLAQLYNKIKDDSKETPQPISAKEKLRMLALEFLFQIVKRHLGNYALDAFNFLDTGGVLNRYNQNHVALALATRYSKRKWIFTTNYDRLIEDALRDLNIDYKSHYFSDGDKVPDPDGLQDENVHLIKLHGTIENKKSMSVTMDQVGIGYGQEKTRFLQDCVKRGYTFCFVGYGVNDFDFYSSFRKLDHEKRMKTYALLQPKGNETVEEYRKKNERIIDFLEKKGGTPIPYDINVFFEIICEEFEKRHLLDEKIWYKVKENRRHYNESELRNQQLAQLEAWSEGIDKFNAYRILGDIYYYLGEEYSRYIYDKALYKPKDYALYPEKKAILLIGLARSYEHTQLHLAADYFAEKAIQLTGELRNSYLQAEALRCSGEMKMVRWGFHSAGIIRLMTALKLYNTLKNLEKEPEKISDIKQAQAHCLQLMYSWCSILPRLIIHPMYYWYKSSHVPERLRPSFLCPEEKLATALDMAGSTGSDTLRFIAILQAKRGAYDKAEENGKFAMDISKWYHEYVGECNSLRALGKIYQWVGRAQESEECFLEGLKIATTKTAYTGDIIKFYLALANLKSSPEFIKQARLVLKEKGIKIDRPDLLLQLYLGEIWYSLLGILRVLKSTLNV